MTQPSFTNSLNVYRGFDGALLVKLVKQVDLLAVRLEVGPYIPVNRDHHLAAQVFRHAQYIDGGHLILHTDRVFPERAEGDINVMILPMFGEVDGKSRKIATND